MILLAAVVLTAAMGGSAAAGAGPTPSPPQPLLVAQGADTSTTAGTQAGAPATTTLSGQGVPAGQTAIVPPPAGYLPLNNGWKSDQMDVRVMPEYDEKAVLVIVSFTLPANVPLPATVKFPIPSGATITGIGEVDPNGNFSYNYATSYPPVEPGAEWDVATIQLKDYRKLQVDYYYDPGIPAGAGERSFPLLVQVPLDAGQLLLHVQQPARSTDFQVQPALQGAGQAGDGFTYSVDAYQDVKSGSTLGHLISYYKSDGGLSVDTEQSGSTQVNTNTVLLAAILIVVVIVGGLVIYRLFFSRAARQRSGRPKSDRKAGSRASATTPARRSTAERAQPRSSKNAQGKGGSPRQGSAKSTPVKSAPTKVTSAATADSTGAATTAGPAVAGAAAGTSAEPVAGTDTRTGPDFLGTASEAASGRQPEYCIACGEELDPGSPFCPNCGEARS